MDAYTFIQSLDTLFIIQAPKSKQGTEGSKSHRAAAAPIQSNVFDAISERHRGYGAAVHRNSLLLIANRENFLRSTPLESELPTDSIEMRRDRIAKYVPRIVPNSVIKKDQSPARELFKSVSEWRSDRHCSVANDGGLVQINLQMGNNESASSLLLLKADRNCGYKIRL
ncbi:hypothetical protein CDAR_446531 [Caerostris darwini]|uniref:Uncharacterized protein n=1 Tax=Caerostris darwini TaxID=1538125 RepID=A0AAV4PQ81_9ARAC|nr:hypothetical protein CDAR_446531 [Caerostris darwini]